jgi:DnaJ-class molecular chaperone
MNPFDVLGVSVDADDDTIRRAYHNLAVQWHPDKYHSNPTEAAAMFLRINEAYSALCDSGGRPSFLRNLPLRPGSLPNPPRKTAFDRLYDSVYGRPMGDETPNPMPHSTGAVEPSAPSDVRVIVTCTLEEVFECAVKMMSVTRRRESGQYEKKTVKVTLTHGVEDGKAICIPGQGHREAGQAPGDLYFVIAQLPHDRFVRVGPDIVEKVTVTLRDVISGEFEIISVAIDGAPIRAKLGNNVQHGHEIRIPARGLHREDGTRGDHVFKVNVVIPNLTPEQLERVLTII